MSPDGVNDIPDLPEVLVEAIVRRSLDEDLGSGGDVTSRAVIPPDATTRAHIVAREGGVLAGVQPASLTFTLVDRTVELRFDVDEGAPVETGEVVATLEGRTRSILTAERTALNFLGHLSGVAEEVEGRSFRGEDRSRLHLKSLTPTLPASFSAWA